MQAELNSTTALTPAEYERAKTRQQRAEDIVYTINHAISCGITDIGIQPFANSWFRSNLENGNVPQWLAGLRKFMHSHDHAHDDTHHDHDHHAHHDHGHDHTAPASKPAPKFWGQFGHHTKDWVMGEAAGDIGAVALTILTQRFFPGLMHGIRTLIEPVVGGLFRSGAQRDARHWAQKHGFRSDAPETKAKADELYEHEISHLPQAVMWNAFSIPINIGVQYALQKDRHPGHLFDITLSKAFGSVVSNTMLIGGRALAPGGFNKWDAFSSKHIVAPATKTVSSLFGIDKKTVDAALKKQQNRDKMPEKWADRVQEQAPETSVATAR